MPAMYLGLILLGFVLGYFFQTWVLVIFTVACVIVAMWMIIKLEEMAVLITMGFIGAAIIANLAMWITYYVVTGQTWMHTLFIRTLR